MLVTLTRTEYKKSCTVGVLRVEGIGHPTLYTLEEPWLNNRPTVSCVPEGTYLCKPHNWIGDKRYKLSRVWMLQNVPKRSGICIHNGNTTLEIEGCILAGLRQGKLGQLDAVLDSKKAMEVLRSIIGEREFTLTIKGVS